MKQPKQDVPVKVDTPDAVARQQMGFGDGSQFGELSGEYVTLAAETDLMPLLERHKNNLCQGPHWGYVLEGTLTASYSDGSEEITVTSELFYWPPGHPVRPNDGSEIGMFTSQDEHAEVLDHILTQMTESA